MLSNGNCQLELIRHQQVIRRNFVVYRVKKRHNDLVAYMGMAEMHSKLTRVSGSGIVQKIKTQSKIKASRNAEHALKMLLLMNF